ncbi:Crp/Fnr family transcriptional regulator [uncultured Clostridium sp.]|uniref:Crp/Fnr family transcriptional regulator n=1 Tax=uncultured Clostridium sp. TaxID=59620 RepID=UPI00261AC2F3|nr:Crp/Fnr family transcriptional regulator [uncultured Clostridium sp.]
MINTLNILKETALFSHFSEDELEKLLNDTSVSLKKYSKEETIFFEGDICTCVSLVISGEVHIQQNNSLGNTLTITKLYPKSMFAENIIFSTKRNYPVDVVAMANSEILHINISTVTKLLMSNETFLVKFLNDLSNKSLVLSSKLRQLNTKSLRERISFFLLTESKKQNSNTIHLNATKEELAKSFGVQRPSLSRELINMKKERLISYDRKTITILNKEFLQDF